MIEVVFLKWVSLKMMGKHPFWVILRVSKLSFILVFMNISYKKICTQFARKKSDSIDFVWIQNLLKYGNYDEFLKYQDKYHGIAFHYISQPIQLLTYKFISNLNEVSLSGAYLISKHSVVFILFFISGIFFYLLSYKLTNNKLFSWKYFSN